MDLSSRAMASIVCIGVISAAIFGSIQSTPVVDITLRWNHATELEDGSSLTPLEIDGYQLMWQKNDGEILGKVALGRNEQFYKIEGIEVGTYKFSLISKTVYGTLSQPSVTVKTVGSVDSIL